MAIAEKRVELRSQTTNVATKDFTAIKDNKALNLAEKEDGLLGDLGGLTDGAGDLLSGVSDAIGDATSSLGDMAKSAMSAVDGVKNSISGAMKQVQGTINQVKGTINQVQGAINQVKSVASQVMNRVNSVKGMVERVCKDPSLSNIAGLGGTLSNLTKNIPGLDTGPISKLADSFGGEIKSAISGVTSGLTEMVSKSGLKSLAEPLTSGTFDTISKAVKDITGKDGLVGMAQKSVESFTNAYTSLYSVAASTRIPGIFGGDLGGKSLAEITGLSKATSKVLGTVSQVKGSLNYLEVAGSTISSSINSFSKNVVDNISKTFTTTDPNTKVLKDAVSTITTAQQKISSMCYKAADGLFSTNTSNGSNSEWTAAAMTSASNNSSKTSSSGIVSPTSKETLLAVSECVKTNDKIRNLNIKTNSSYVNSYLTSTNKTFTYTNNNDGYISYDTNLANLNKYRNTSL